MISHFIFPDGIVEGYEFSRDELRMRFKDSSDNGWLLIFRGQIEVMERGSIGYSVFRGHLENNGDRTKLRLLDDDLKETLTISFNECVITESS